MIKAILRDGCIQPIEPLPPDWAEGQELTVDEPVLSETEAELTEWAGSIESAAAKIPPEEHDRFFNALGEIERKSKDAVRREWGLP